MYRSSLIMRPPSCEPQLPSLNAPTLRQSPRYDFLIHWHIDIRICSLFTLLSSSLLRFRISKAIVPEFFLADLADHSATLFQVLRQSPSNILQVFPSWPAAACVSQRTFLRGILSTYSLSSYHTNIYWSQRHNNEDDSLSFSSPSPPPLIGHVFLPGLARIRPSAL